MGATSLFTPGIWKVLHAVLHLDTFGMQITPIKLADEATNLGQTLTRTRHLDHETCPSATAFRFYGGGANRSYS